MPRSTLTRATDFMRDNMSGDLVKSGQCYGKNGTCLTYRMESGITYRLATMEVEVMQRFGFKPRYSTDIIKEKEGRVSLPNFSSMKGKTMPHEDELQITPATAGGTRYYMLELSTAHLTEQVAGDLLSGELSLPVAVKHDEYGFFLTAAFDFIGATRPPVPECLKACLQRAVDLKCEFISFDRDAEILKDLPSYDW